MRRNLGVFGLAIALSLPRFAAAQPGKDPATADELFDRAKELLRAGDWVGACEKFEESMALDPSVSTELKIARCHEHEGKLTLALHDYQSALERNRRVIQAEQRRAALEEFAKRALAELEPRVPKLEVVMPERPPGLRLMSAGRELPLAALRDPLPADPGPLELVAEAPGYGTFRRTVFLVEGQTTAVAITLLPSAPIDSSAKPSSPVAEPPSPARSSGAQRIIAFSVGGAGLVAIGFAAWFGLQTLAKVNDSSQYCQGERCQQPGLDLRDQARGTETAALVCLFGGAALVGAGIVLLATSPRDHSAHVALGLTPSGLLAEGAF
jgi:hypothetical protein